MFEVALWYGSAVQIGDWIGPAVAATIAAAFVVPGIAILLRRYAIDILVSILPYRLRTRWIESGGGGVKPLSLKDAERLLEGLRGRLKAAELPPSRGEAAADRDAVLRQLADVEARLFAQLPSLVEEAVAKQMRASSKTSAIYFYVGVGLTVVTFVVALLIGA